MLNCCSLGVAVASAIVHSHTGDWVGDVASVLEKDDETCLGGVMGAAASTVSSHLWLPLYTLSAVPMLVAGLNKTCSSLSGVRGIAASPSRPRREVVAVFVGNWSDSSERLNLEWAGAEILPSFNMLSNDVSTHAVSTHTLSEFAECSTLVAGFDRIRSPTWILALRAGGLTREGGMTPSGML
eukprot:1279149-Pyramimonas_sp.AAC.1